MHTTYNITLYKTFLVLRCLNPHFQLLPHFSHRRDCLTGEIKICSQSGPSAPVRLTKCRNEWRKRTRPHGAILQPEPPGYQSTGYVDNQIVGGAKLGSAGCEVFC